MWGDAGLPNKTKTKKDKCDRACLVTVFTSTMYNAGRPQCVVCFKILASDSVSLKV